MGGIAGDIIGSVYEWHNAKGTKDIEFFRIGCRATDDSVLSCAVAEWLIDDRDATPEVLVEKLREFGNAFPYAGYGGMFRKWLAANKPKPMNSFGNGAGMRCSAVGYFAESEDEVLDLAKRSAEVTHNHPEGIKGAQAIALGVYMASTGNTKEEIKAKIEKVCGYDLSKGVTRLYCLNDDGDVIWRPHKFDATCQVTVPEAIIAFLSSKSYEDAIEKALLIGGDSDTIADMTGALAGAYYGVPQWIQYKVLELLPDKLSNTIFEFEDAIQKSIAGTAVHLV